MKKYFFLFLILTAGILQSCQKADSPKLVAEKFLNAMSERNYAEAGKYATKETKKLLKQLQKIDELSGPSDDLKPEKVSIVSEEIQGKKAVVYFKEEGNDLEQTITLKKVEEGDNDPEWKVALKKEEIRLNRDPGLDLQQQEEETPAKLPS
ncbi:MAG TPA: DUF4878 domain-containing protein [Bacteroidia bacterium]|jgi:hypothetical protein|nr:DUF4878 domain-containing protein [Bacteroidia bacterium]HQF29329.1 DUF4878 domain-containing protein [Bacteroidia bacterium]HQK98955.1 DUF4878 domain-containing protein [Bacteroidia bacterium]